MADGGRILGDVLDRLLSLVRPGIETLALAAEAERLIKKAGATPAFKGYKGFPQALCVSINEEVVHGVPSERRLKKGELISLDLGVYYEGFYTDGAVTVPIGRVSPRALKLVRVTWQALQIGLSQVKPGGYLGDIGKSIEDFVVTQGFSVVRELCGHGIGRRLHQGFQVPNFGQKGSGRQLTKGMTFTIEPMVSMGQGEVSLSANGFTYVTKDGSLSAHFEETVAVTRKGYRLLTPIEKILNSKY